MTLRKSGATRTLLADAQDYLHQALGAETRIEHWQGASRLPASLHSAFDLHELELHSRKILLARSRGEGLPSVRILCAQLDELIRIANIPPVLLISALTSSEQRRLVEHKVPFLVPGNQLYLPDLGIDFREYFRRPCEAVITFAPATQAVFIAALLRGLWRSGWEPAELVAELGYTAMTLTRAVRELSAAGLVSAHQEGRIRRVSVELLPAQAWQQAAPFLRSPVRRTVWVDRKQLLKQLRAPLAGHSALASIGLMAEPEYPTYGISVWQWKMVQRTGVQVLPEPRPGACQCEIWSYNPSPVTDTTIVDRLSLALRLQGDSAQRLAKVAAEELLSTPPHPARATES